MSTNPSWRTQQAPFSIERKRRHVELYDPGLQFNRIVEIKENSPETIIYSVDGQAMLKVLQQDDLTPLYKITLACRQTRDGTSMWDVLFNESRRHSTTSCVLLAQNNYQPIPSERIVYTSQFLNFNKPITRSHLNHIVPGDRIGIAINDINNENVYVLLYIVEDFGMATTKIDKSDQTLLVSSANVKLEHALLLGSEGLTITSMEEDNEFNSDLAKPFVEWLIDTVDDIIEGFPWKPHFRPFIPKDYKRQILEDRTAQQIEVALDTNYDDFEQLCKSAYRRVQDDHRRTNGRATKVRPGARKDHPQQPEAKSQFKPKPPVVSVVTQGDYFYARFALGNRDNDTTYKIARADLGKKAQVETFFTNSDLEHVMISESSKVFILSPGRFGEHAYLRYFELSF